MAPSTSSLPTRLFQSTPLLLTTSTLLRILLLLYGLYQDAHSPLKYTDIDYHVFTSASQYTSQGLSPYTRETYRYTPLLSFLLLPTTWSSSPLFFHSGKLLFALCDIVAGWLLIVLLRSQGMSSARAGKYASIWLLNPMVATISTRGSSEGILGVMTVGLVWAVVRGRWVLAGGVLGLATHFKIYPVVYGVSVLWWMDGERIGGGRGMEKGGKGKYADGAWGKVMRFMSWERVVFVVSSLITFCGLNVVMYKIYGPPFLQHTYLHHLTRIDHRHNFSPYNILLYLRSAIPSDSLIPLESLAFIPQLFLSIAAIPLVLAKKDLAATMLAQTFAFVAFNKVCTSQYFLWYTILLPLYLPSSSLLQRPSLGLLAATLWVLTQALWLHQAFQLEFLGHSTFVPGLWVSSLLFFATNVWILGVVVRDIGVGEDVRSVEKGKGVKR
ncbi:GPI mannosyltransferase 1 protein [Rutstroemia sp. NJR-2017a BBW]|nr:GPI mannosyltransferase 1 protein [Rutstroemia sp. NJR-2017a BBW]